MRGGVWPGAGEGPRSLRWIGGVRAVRMVVSTGLAMGRLSFAGDEAALEGSSGGSA